MSKLLVHMLQNTMKDTFIIYKAKHIIRQIIDITLGLNLLEPVMAQKVTLEISIIMSLNPGLAYLVYLTYKKCVAIKMLNLN